MEREQLIERVQRQMPAKRWEHTVGVMETAVALAKRYGGSVEKADLAALLHDYAKFWPIDRQRQVMVEAGLPGELMHHDKQLWHSHIGAYIAHSEMGIEDEEILDAIRYHTSGRVNMTLLDKIVCLADYMEPGRQFPGVETIRELAEISLEKALIAGFDSTISFLLEKKKVIFPLTVLARNDLIEQLKAQA